VLKRFLLPVFAMMLGLALTSGVTSAGQSALSSPANLAPDSPTCGWAVAPWPNADLNRQTLYGVGVVSPNDAWGVGVLQPNGQHVQPLIMHWNGTSWDMVPHPLSGQRGELKKVGVVSANDVWAVGRYWPDGGQQLTLAMRWNGSQWSVVPTPNFSTVNSLEDITVISANDIWAAGGYGVAIGEGGPLTMHWNGVAWTLATTPNGPEGSALLWGISAVSSNDVWAVGDENVPVGAYRTDRTFTIHWDGVQWSYVPSPNVGDRNNIFYSVDAISSNDVWAVGTRYNRNDATWYPLIQQWDGTQWKISPTPHAGPNSNFLNAVTAVGPNDVWAVGFDFSQNPRGVLLLHWNGILWDHISIPEPPGHIDVYDIAHLSADDILFVGMNYHYEGLRRDVALVGRYTGPCGTPQPTPTLPAPSPTRTSTSVVSTPTAQPTNTPPAATATSMPSTNTPVASATPPPPTNTPQLTPPVTSTVAATSTVMPTATAPLTATSVSTAAATASSTSTSTPQPTSCAVSFSDVPAGNTFYPFVQCLACQGVISGYSDGTFRPNSPITRGQLSKIVANAAAFGEQPTGQSFQDVGADNTFYLYIERMASRSIIGGYPCGGPGEPCGDGSKPYFRPNSNATRGQISKIVANAAALAGEPGAQIFEDVPPGSGFYDWVQRLASAGIIGGYECGSPGEPCGPTRRPYFRPGSNATRGQVSKIVGKTFYPNCGSPARR